MKADHWYADRADRKWWEELVREPYPHDEDEQLRSELHSLLADLPDDHPAVVALSNGWAAPVVIRHLSWANDKPRIEAMQRAYEEWRKRCPVPAGHSTPPRGGKG